MIRLVALAAVCALVAAGCGARAPKGDPGVAALKVVDQITHNRYVQAWGDLHSEDQHVAPLAEYVGCESRSLVPVSPLRVRVVRVNDESVGLGNGRFVSSKAVDVRLAFYGGYQLVHTVHVVAEDGHWKWILPSWRFRDYRADRCPHAAETPAPDA